MKNRTGRPYRWLLALAAMLSGAFLAQAEPSRFESVGGFFKNGAKMICLTNHGRGPMLGIVFVSPTGRVAVVDGGHADDAEALLEILSRLGNAVDYWFITHCHDDHFGALYRMLTDHSDRMPKIGELRYSFPPDEWLRKHERMCVGIGNNFRGQLLKHRMYGRPLKSGDVYDLGGGTTFEALNDFDLSITANAVNNSSLCLSIRHGGRSILVPGDLGEQGGDRLLKLIPGKLPHEIVFASHHGQNGVGKSFYAAVAPRVVIWPTPDWLWDNDASFGAPGKSQGPGSGAFKTNYVKCWFQELGVKRHYVLSQKDMVFE